MSKKKINNNKQQTIAIDDQVGRFNVTTLPHTHTGHHQVDKVASESQQAREVSENFGSAPLRAGSTPWQGHSIPD